MKRYFYADPLAAEWMKRHFEMMFADLSKPIWWHEDAMPRKIYINSDSLDLLEPRSLIISSGETETTGIGEQNPS